VIQPDGVTDPLLINNWGACSEDQTFYIFQNGWIDYGIPLSATLGLLPIGLLSNAPNFPYYAPMLT